MFPGDQLSMPGQQGLWRDDSGYLGQKPPRQQFGLAGQSAVLIVVEPNAPLSEMLP
jgi:hypothetical protein